MTETSRKASLALAALALLLPGAASAQLYKCRGPDGKVVYSDSKCDATEAGALKVRPNSTTPSEREIAAAEAAAAAAAAAKEAAGAAARPQQGPPGASIQPASAPVEYVLTGSDRERLTSLETTRGSLGATREQKSAIEVEMRNIRNGRDARLSSEQRSRRDALQTDLGSLDAQKRQRALSEFRALYD